MEKNKKLGEGISRLIGLELLVAFVLLFVWVGQVEETAHAPLWCTISLLSVMALVAFQCTTFSRLYLKRKSEMRAALALARARGEIAKVMKIEADIREFRAFGRRGCFADE